MVSSKKRKQKLIWRSVPVGSHSSGQFICCVHPKLAFLLELLPGYEAVMTAFEMRPAWVETNKNHSTYIPQQCLEGQAHCAICCLQPSRGMPIIFSKQKCWSSTAKSNTFNLLAKCSSFFKKIHPSFWSLALFFWESSLGLSLFKNCSCFCRYV